MMNSAILLVGNGRLVTRDPSFPFIENGCVVIRDELIVEIGPTDSILAAYPAERFIDARGGLIMPGLINGHTHLYSTFARGMALKDAAPGNFHQILERLWWRLDKALTLEDVYLSAQVAIIDCIRNGTTTIFDHHASPGAVQGSLSRIADAARLTGVRSCLCYEVSDRDGIDIALQGIEENRTFLSSCQQSNNNLLRGLFGLHASFTVTDRTLEQCAGVAAEFDSGFHVHVAEAASDVAHCQRQYGKSIVDRFHQWGILGSKTIAAHCVHINDHEISLLHSTKTNVIHNPESNMGNAVGCAPVINMVERGVSVGLGSDGYTSDMFESLKVANLLHKHQSGQPAAAWAEPPAMLFNRNAQLTTAIFGNTVGKLMPGACADLIVADYDPPTPLTTCNIEGHILFGISGRSVRSTIIAGRVVMLDRVLPGIDEESIMARAREAAAHLWERF